MAEDLVIVESPTKAKTLGKYLGKGYIVKASMGHLIDLPTGELGVDVDKGFAPKYVVVKGREKTLKELVGAAEKAGQVYLASDPDREGEAIAYHIANRLGRNSKKIKRILLYEITREAVKRALEEPREIDLAKVEAQQARRILDRLVGYLVSPILWKTVRRGLSAGRVQSVALRLICEREKEILAFVRQEYWTIELLLKGKKEPFGAKLATVGGKPAEIKSQEQAQELSTNLRKATYRVEEVERKEKKRNPPPPFITSTMQQEASKRLGFSASRTMSVAQQLYEGIEIGDEGPVGLITYMRTDAVRMNEDAVQQARKYIGDKFGETYLPPEPNVYRSRKTAQGAHEAIRPTDVKRAPDALKEHLSKDQQKLYQLIWARFVACQMNPAVYDTVTVKISGESSKETYGVRATGSALKFPGFLAVYRGDDEENEEPFPQVEEGEALKLQQIEPKQHFTEPSPRYTEASLIKELESRGIGRPSTYAPILSVIQKRDYVSKEKTALKPMELGAVVNDLLVSRFPDTFDYGFTAEMEEELDKVEEQEMGWQKVLQNFYRPFKSRLAGVEKDRQTIRDSLARTEETCELCGKPMVLRWSRYGKFLACSGYPECKNLKPLGENQEPEAEKTDEKCPTCGAEMVVRRGRFGRFLACSRYPKCKTTKPFGIGLKCPRPGCGGEIVEKRTKAKRIFYSCNRYPKCKLGSWERPANGKCSQCGKTLVKPGRKGASGSSWICLVCEEPAEFIESSPEV
jgi:DNA topoisomerase-1